MKQKYKFTYKKKAMKMNFYAKHKKGNTFFEN